ncbi:MAG: T9SS type A sorting domain-containing protein [Sphingobacteriaceae bacterium]|nr:T9SS type A sorting domain-containing protein [Sphingobacteriaceae bacterium]
MKKFLLSIGILSLSISGNAQEYWEIMQDPNGNFYNAQQKFEDYYAGKDINEKGKGYKIFKRWESFVEQRVYPTGDLSLLAQTAPNYQAWLDNYNAQQGNNGGGKYGQIGGNNIVAAATWSPVGPMGPIAGTGNGQFLKSGRINGFVAHPTNTNIVYACAPAGGFWRSYNAGTTWVTTTDNMPNTGCSDAAVDPSNTNIIYLATGDGDAGDNPSIGVYKSFDAGVTFTPTGLTYTFSAGARIRRIIVNPNTPSVVIAATNGGIRRNTNGGAGAWATADGNNCYDLEFQPGNPNIVYSAGTSFRRSTNGGASFTQITNGIPTTGISRMAIAVTPANPQVVYVLASLSSNNGFQGLYRSVDGGVTFTQMSNSPNLLGWSNTGGDTGGQGWYDLCIAASPTNSNEIVTGGVNVWRSTTGGATGGWSLYGHWTGSGAPFTHADHHDLEYDIVGNLYNANDGTVYRRNGGSWLEVSGQMNLSQIYKLGTSSQTANFWITGHQDNGTSIWTGTTYSAQLGGDGMDCFIDRTTNANKFAEYYNGAFRRSIGGGPWSTCTTGMTGAAPWVTIWKQDPTNNTRLHAGRQEMFVSNNLAGSWTQNGTMPVTGSIREFAIAPSNNQVIYVLKSNAIIKTTNGGTNWTNVTNGAPIGSAAPDFVVVHPTNPNIAWVMLSGYSAANKVLKTTNGGTSWTNITGNLPNIPATCGVFQLGSNDRIYIGMDIGVYYIDNGLANWVPYQYNLPNIPVSDLEISPADPGKLIASTYGRGTWKVDVIAAAAPVTALSYTGSLCTGVPKPFNDFSANAPTVWSWSVAPMGGVSISSSTVANPIITFANPGTYTVSLFTSNIYGPGTTASQVVSVTAMPNVLISNPSQTICNGSSAILNASGAMTYSWSNGINSQSISVTPTASTIYNVVGGVNGCNGSANATITVGGGSLTISANSPSICNGNSAVLSASGAISYTWSTGSLTSTTSVSPGLTSTYTVTGSSGGGCTGVYISTVTVNNNPTVTASNANICSGASTVLTASGASTYSWSNGALTNTTSVSPGSTTVYTVTGSNGNCNNVQTVTVNVTTSPTVVIANNTQSVCSGNSVVISASGAASYLWNTGSSNPSISVSPSVTSVYTVTGLTGGCTNVKTATVNVTQTPTVTVNGAVICVGATTTLNASGAVTYSWNTGSNNASIAVSPTTTTVYNVTGYNGNCNSVSNATITVNQLPNITINSSGTLVCLGNTLNLSAVGATSYTWQPGNLNGPSQTYSPSANQTYTVYGTDGNNCNNTQIIAIVVTPCTGILKNSNGEMYFAVYPNPASENVIVSYPSTLDSEIFIEVIDAGGKLIKTTSHIFNLSNPNYSIGISEVANGVYFLNLKVKDGESTLLKLIKE